MTIQTDRTQQAATILKRSVCVTLSLHWLGNDRKVDVDEFVTDAGVKDKDDSKVKDLSQFSVTKKLIDRHALRPVRRPMGQAKSFMRSIAIAANEVFGDRSYLVPVGLVEYVDGKLTEYANETKSEAALLAQRYGAEVAQAKTRLGKQFNAKDYATPDYVASAFSIDWSYVSFAAPENLETVSHVLAAEANRKHQEKLAQAFDEWVLGMRQSALDILSDLDERLKPGSDGKRKSLRDTALRDLERFIELLPQRNVVEDDELAAVMAKVAARSQGMDVEQLKDSVTARKALRSAVLEAKKTLSGLVEKAARRAITFGSLGDAA